MSVLQALDRYYDRMADRGEAEPIGYSREKISFAVVLSTRGEPIDVTDLRDAGAKRPRPALLEVPAAVTRTVAILPNLFWDKSAYALGRTATGSRRTAEEHAAFKVRNLSMVQESEDEGLVAFRRFLTNWEPGRFDASPFTTEMLDTNFVFRLDGEHGFIHERPAAKRLVEALVGPEGPTAVCLVTGAEGPIRRLHPTIRGVEGAQSSGAALVSFNLDAFKSYDKEQGDNAPTSEVAAFRYGAALNRMLDRTSRNRLARPLGDATVVFWADTSESVAEESATTAESLFAGWLDPGPEPDNDADRAEAAKLRDALKMIAEGRPVERLGLRLTSGTRFHVLGLAPNAARLSIRYWLDEEFDVLARRLADHYADFQIDPRPWRAKPPSIQRLLMKTTALQEKFDNIPPMLAGEMMRSVLTGARYPRTLLSAVIMRLRAGDDPASGWHAAAIRAVLARDERLRARDEGRPVKGQETPMSLDRENPNPAYQLGRLFAAMETAQRLALGKVNSTIRDRYFGAASASPAGVFPLLYKNLQNHLGKLRREGKGGWIEREITDITDRLSPGLPRSLKLEGQGRFAIGYYHQRKAQFAGRPAADVEGDEEAEGEEDGQ
jgi:CRISPR-associated protein Csd1